tara:strand:- start:9648 stop:11621 length:1974 start_codon:yes stop_codon:yes gene_type:complete
LENLKEKLFNFILSKPLNIFLIILILIIPWVPSFLDSGVEIQELTDDLGFYETYTCQVSYLDFQLKNIFTIYQDHYRINLNKYSEVPCYGKLTGLDRVGDIFYISIGLNPLITLLTQSIFLFLVLQLLKKDKKLFINENSTYFISLLASSALITFGFYSQIRYYQKSFVSLNFQLLETYLIIFSFILFSSYLLVHAFNSRSMSLVNYFPFLFLIIGVPYGLNLYIYFLIFVFFGIYKALTSSKTLKRLFLFCVLIFIWITSVKDEFSFASEGNNYYLNPDKMVGLSSTVYSYESVIYWSLLFFFLLTGIMYYLEKVREKINYVTIKYSFYFVSMAVAFLSYLNTEVQPLNAASQIYFGQNKASTRDLPQEIFTNWRGYFPSAEQMGEFFSLTIILFLSLKYLKNINTNRFEYIPLGISVTFLFLSFNRTAIVLTILFAIFIFFKGNKHLLNRRSASIGIILVLLSMSIIYFNDQIFAYSFTSNKLLVEAKNNVAYEQYSRSLLYLDTNLKSNILLKTTFGIFSTVSFYLNRSYLWGLFFARYNPTPKEFLFGTGPYNLSSLYNEVQVADTSSFLWPHSSLLQLLFYFGIVGLIVIIYLLLKRITSSLRNNSSHLGRYLFIFMLINLFKSDSIMYFSTVFTTLFFYNSIKFEDFEIKK